MSGKDAVTSGEKDDTMLHENEAAQILYDMCKNDHMHPSDVKEGKIELIADCDGLLKVDREKLKKISNLGEMMITTRHGDTYVKKATNWRERELFRSSSKRRWRRHRQSVPTGRS